MSLDSLLANDQVTFYPEVITQDSSGGPVRTLGKALYSNVPARVIDPSADEQLRFLMLGTVAPHRIIHRQQGAGGEGTVAVSSDGRTIKVQGTRTIRTLGGIDTYYITTGTEWRPGA